MQKKVTDSKESNPKVYEVGYHIVSTIAEENVPTETDKIKALLDKEGAVIISEEAPKLRTLAYNIRKAFGSTYKNFDTAYFGWIKFELDGEVANIEKAMKNNENVLRYILVKTVKESTLYTPKANTFSKEAKKMLKTEAPKDARPASIEEIDKSIEELVA